MDKWKAPQDVQDLVTELIANHHANRLAEISDEIIVIFKERCSKKGGVPVLGTTSKAPAILNVFGYSNVSYVIEIGFDEWNLKPHKEQVALLDHLLCHIGGEEDEESGSYKFFLRQPDICYFSEEVERHGHWRKGDEEDGL